MGRFDRIEVGITITDMESMLHYYGDLVRRLFLAGAVIMLLTLPVLNPLLPVSIFYSLLAIIALSLVAGFTTPAKKWTIMLDEMIATVAVLVFEYYAVNYYIEYSAGSSLFIVNQVLAFDFLVALYYNTKTFRAMVAK